MRKVRRSGWMVAWPVVALAACSSRSHDPLPSPQQVAGVYDLEVPTTGGSATLVISTPVSEATRDSLWVHTGAIIECGRYRLGRLVCGPYDFRVYPDGLRGTGRVCNSTTVPTTRTVTDATSGVTRRVPERATRTTCYDVPLTIVRRADTLTS